MLYFTLDPCLIMLSVKQGGIKYHFWVFGMIRPGMEPQFSRPLANTLLIRPMARFLLKHIAWTLQSENFKLELRVIWFGLVLWHINHFWLFNAKFFLYIYCTIFTINLCVKWTYNVHYDRTYKEHRNLWIRKHVMTSCSGTKPFY